jgi:hypothetical protein
MRGMEAAFSSAKIYGPSTKSLTVVIVNPMTDEKCTYIHTSDLRYDLYYCEITIYRL